jgi:hypothetical protein
LRNFCIILFLFTVFKFFVSGINLLVGIAGENLAESVPESEGERCQQFALGLQKFTSNIQLACETKVIFYFNISGFPETTYFSGVYPAKFRNLFFWCDSSLVDDL